MISTVLFPRAATISRCRFRSIDMWSILPPTSGRGIVFSRTSGADSAYAREIIEGDENDSMRTEASKFLNPHGRCTAGGRSPLSWRWYSRDDERPLPDQQVSIRNK